MSRHFWWKQALGLTPGDPSVDEHAFMSEVLQLSITFDMLNAGELACVEAISRRYQLIEELYSMEMDRAQAGDVDWAGERRLFMGSTLGRHGCLVSPELREWLATEVSKTAAVMKERRKAREERLLARGVPAYDPASGDGASTGRGRGRGRGGK